MLVAVLNTCTKEELEEHDEDLAIMSPITASVETAERRKIIKNKIMAVGRMARVFAVLRYVGQVAFASPHPDLYFTVSREESEKVSELKSVLGSSKLPYGTLASGTEGIRDAIKGFDDACVIFIIVDGHQLTRQKIPSHSRKSDIENERLPPDLFDADSEEGKAILGSSSSQPSTPAENAVQPAPVSANGVAESLERAIAAKVPPPAYINTSGASSLSFSSISPISPIATPSPGAKRGHSRQASLGTTMTSPSNRRRSLESTMSLIQGVLDGKPGGRIEEDEDMDGLTNRLAGSSVGKTNNASPGPSRSSGR